MSADLSATALYAWSMVLARAIVVPALFERSVKNLQQRSSLGKSVPLFGPSLLTHLRQQHLFPLKLHR